jgi:hypothetical protein
MIDVVIAILFAGLFGAWLGLRLMHRWLVALEGRIDQIEREISLPRDRLRIPFAAAGATGEGEIHPIHAVEAAFEKRLYPDGAPGRAT